MAWLYFLALLGTAQVKAVHKMLVKLTPARPSRTPSCFNRFFATFIRLNRIWRVARKLDSNELVEGIRIVLSDVDRATTQLKNDAGVNFINILCVNFLYERYFGSFSLITCTYFSSCMYVKRAAKMMFVQKICTQNVDEIDTRIATVL